MSVAVMSWVWKHSRSRGTDRLVLLAIADAADDDGTNAWPAMDTLAHKTHLSKSTIRRATSALAALGELRVHYRCGPSRHTSAHPAYRCNRYTVLMRHPEDPWPPNLDSDPTLRPAPPAMPDPAEAGQDASPETDANPNLAPAGETQGQRSGDEPPQHGTPETETAAPDTSASRRARTDRSQTGPNHGTQGGHRRRAGSGRSRVATQPIQESSSIEELSSPTATRSSTAAMVSGAVVDPVPAGSSRRPGRPNRLAAGQVAAEHWQAVTPKPVLRGGFNALRDLAERFLDAGCTPTQVLWALRHTRAYTADAITYTIRQATVAQPRLSAGDTAVAQAQLLHAHVAAQEHLGDQHRPAPIAALVESR